jgi:hypothetical protein
VDMEADMVEVGNRDHSSRGSNSHGSNSGLRRNSSRRWRPQQLPHQPKRP